MTKQTPGRNPDSLASRGTSVKRLFFLIALSIFIAEMSVMFILHLLDASLTEFQISLLDSGILILFVTPMLYFLFYRPMIREIAHRKQAEEEHLRLQRLESLGLLASGIAHDFNNMLTGIFSNISLARNYIDKNSKADKRLAKAEMALDKARALSTQLMTFSDGGLPVKAPIDINRLLMDTVELALSGRNVAAEFDIAPHLWWADGDEGQLSQVIHNLIINSQQAMPEGGKITVKAQNVIIDDESTLSLNHGKYVKLSFMDHGHGIDAEAAKKVFDPYFTTKESGRGLGLSIVQSIIKNHKGHIEMSSIPGTGTQFVLYLQALEPDLKNKPSANANNFASDRVARILILEDDAVVLESAVELLASLGHIVEHSTKGEETLFMYQKAIDSGTLYDILILDLTIADGMGGLEVLQRIKAIDPGVKAIVSSGYSNDPVMSNLAKYGFKAALNKPYTPDEAKKVINLTLRG